MNGAAATADERDQPARAASWATYRAWRATALALVALGVPRGSPPPGTRLPLLVSSTVVVTGLVLVVLLAVAGHR